jgi:hypothetical protein
MKPEFVSSEELVSFSSQKKMYNLLLEQLEKDFNYSGVDLKIRKNCSPNKLVETLQYEIKKLVLNDFAGYLNLLYRIDVSEIDIKKTDASNFDLLSQQVCFLILKREWQKVWIRSNMSN